MAADALTAANECDVEALVAEKMATLKRAFAFEAAPACAGLEVAAKSTAALDAENGQGGARAGVPRTPWKARPPQPPPLLNQGAQVQQAKASSAAQDRGRCGSPAKAPAPPLPSP